MVMGFKHFIFALLADLALILAVHAQDQTGFISIACGAQEDSSSFTESKTGITYTSDAAFIDTGISKSISRELRDNHPRYLRTLRSFPQGIRNCYTINVTAATRYLIRATFLHGNYDGNGNLPQFDLYLGANMWDTIKLKISSIEVTKELIHVPSLNYIHVCLVNIGSGTPFISAIGLRPLKNTTYITKYGSLALLNRWDIGASRSVQVYKGVPDVRYPDDVYDRFWDSYGQIEWKNLTTQLDIHPQNNDYQPHSIVMRTAATPADDRTPLKINWDDSENGNSEYYVYMYFAEVEKLQPKQSRSFNITINGQYWKGPITPDYLSPNTQSSTSAISGSAKYEVSIFKMENSTLPPIINAIEIYSVKYLSQSETDQGDVFAIEKIKSEYEMKRNWQGDPCAPKEYSWEGLNCSYDGYSPPRITSLNLSSSELNGDISASISNLVMLKSLDLSNNCLTGPVPDFLPRLQNLTVLDLSNNNLTGSVPDFLSQLRNLTILNLERNQLSGPVPAELIARSKNGSLSLRIFDNATNNIIPSVDNNINSKKKNNIVVPKVASLGGLLILSLIIAATLLRLRRKRQDKTKDTNTDIQKESLELAQRQFTYSELLNITNNFERILGKGGFGTVYYGNIGNTQVAVKMMSPSSTQGFQQFQSEVKLLMMVHHKNLTTFVGYCYEENNIGLIYEYMVNGDLKAHLSGENAKILNWEHRLRIAMDAAQGLEYLHNGCKPPIIHRDVKPTNILLNENFHAKLADFGLSKIFPTDSGTHMSTVVAGTPGYLDPEYYISNWLTGKSDVYSFGVVLLEIITGRPALEGSREKTHIIQWVSFLLDRGDIKNIVDTRLSRNFNINSAWKVVEIAMACVSAISAKRPTMSQVVVELKECLAIELARTVEGHEGKPTNSIDVINMNLSTEVIPLAR